MESILLSVKEQLGLSEEVTEFDDIVLSNINSAIITLYQLGVGPIFVVKSKDDTYEDYLGVDSVKFNMVPMYLYYKTRLGFDPPENSFMMQNVKDQIAELEFRLNVYAESGIMSAIAPVLPEDENEPSIPDPTPPEQEGPDDDNEGGENQNGLRFHR